MSATRLTVSERLALAGCTRLVGQTDPAELKQILAVWATSRNGGSLTDEIEALAATPNVKKAWVLDAARDAGLFSASREIVITPFSRVKKRHTEWLWNRRIAADHLNLIGGPGGCGKSTMISYLAAKWTRGLPLPGETVGRDPVNVLLYLTEDNDYTVRQRLNVEGADLDRVFHMVGQGDPDNPINLSLDDIPRIKKVIRRTGARVLVFDSFKDFTRVENDYAESQVRQGLAPVKDLARHEKIAVVGIVHFGKSQGRSASDSILGSVAWRDSARSVVVVNWLEGENGERGVGVAKTNNDNPATIPVLVFDLKPAGDVARVEWEKTPRAGLTVADLAPRAPVTPEDRSAISSAKDFLLGELAGGPVPTKTLQAAAEAAGHSWRTINRAKSDLPIMAKKEGYPGEWKWELHQGCQTPSEPAQVAHLASLASFVDDADFCGDPTIKNAELPKGGQSHMMAPLAPLENQEGAE